MGYRSFISEDNEDNYIYNLLIDIDKEGFVCAVCLKLINLKDFANMDCSV